jgi:hypothetical protein
MQSGISDTNPEAEQVQIALLRQAGMARRVELAAELTSFAIEGAYTALRCRYPEASALEIDLLFVEQQYGLALADRLRAALMPSAGEQDSSLQRNVERYYSCERTNEAGCAALLY